MNSYTITIAPNDDTGAATRLIVDTSGDQVRITDVHLHAPQGLSSRHIPTIDVDLLLRAVAGTATESTGHNATDTTALSTPHGTPAIEAAAPAEQADQPAAPAPTGRTRKATPRAATTPSPRRAAARARTAASDDAASAPRQSPRAGATPKARSVKPAPAKATGKTTMTTPAPAPTKKQATGRAAATKTQTPRTRTRTAGTAAASATSGRVYRRTPDDLAAVFEQVGTVTGVAAHYQVPGYTAQGWVSRLRAGA